MNWQNNLKIQAAALEELPDDCTLGDDIDGALELSRSIPKASSLDRTRGDYLAQDLMDRGLIACTATDAHDATRRVPSSILNEWGTSVLTEGLE